MRGRARGAPGTSKNICFCLRRRGRESIMAQITARKRPSTSNARGPCVFLTRGIEDMQGVPMAVLCLTLTAFVVQSSSAAEPPAAPIPPSPRVIAAPSAVVPAAPVSTNEVEALQKKLAETEAENAKLQAKEEQLKVDYRTSVQQLRGVATNAPSDEESAKMVKRIGELEAELMELRQKRDAKMLEDPVFKGLRDKVDKVRAEMEQVRARREELRLQRMNTAGRIWQIGKRRELEAAATNETKATVVPKP